MLIRVIARLVEVVHVQLANKRREVVVLEVLRQNLLGELIHLLHNEPVSCLVPADYVSVLRVLTEGSDEASYVDDVVGLDQEGWHVGQGCLLSFLLLLL
jgi:hypothetical protein